MVLVMFVPTIHWFIGVCAYFIVSWIILEIFYAGYGLRHVLIAFATSIAWSTWMTQYMYPNVATGALEAFENVYKVCKRKFSDVDPDSRLVLKDVPLTDDEILATPLRSCAMYFTKNIEECNKGYYEMHAKDVEFKLAQLQAKPSKSSTDNELIASYEKVLEDYTNMPYESICKLDMTKMKEPLFFPLKQYADEDYASRGDPTHWAHCFHPVDTEEQKQSLAGLVTKHPDTAQQSKHVTKLSDDVLYDRLEFKSMELEKVEPFFCSVFEPRNAIKKQLVAMQNKTILRIHLSEKRTILRITACIANPDGSITPVKDVKASLSQFFEENVVNNTLIYQFKKSAAVLYRFHFNVCDKVDNMKIFWMNDINAFFAYSINAVILAHGTAENLSEMKVSYDAVVTAHDSLKTRLIDISNELAMIVQETESFIQAFIQTIGGGVFNRWNFINFKQSWASKNVQRETNRIALKGERSVKTGLFFEAQRKKEFYEYMIPIVETGISDKLDSIVPDTKGKRFNLKNPFQYVSNDYCMYLTMYG